MSGKETPLGKAHRIYEADVGSAWDDYRGAIREARKGKIDRLVQLFVARRQPEEDGFDLLAGFIRDKFRKPGNQLEELPHKVALLALVLRGVKKPGIATGSLTVAATDREAAYEAYEGFEAYLKRHKKAVEKFEAYLKGQSEAIQRGEQQIAHPESDPIIDTKYHKTIMGLIEIAFEMIIREVNEPVDRDAVISAALTLIRNRKRLGSTDDED
jgi:predicted transcriptional regulator YdeE